MDYYQIGQRIRKTRKAMGLSQEELASKAEISLTHMSHIETGNTKLSLPVLVALAQAMEVSCDTLLFDEPPANRTSAEEQLQTVLADCSARELHVLADMSRTAKSSLRKYYPAEF